MKKLFSLFILAIGTFSLGSCSIGNGFHWQDVVSGERFYYEVKNPGDYFWTKHYIDFSYSGEYYETGIVGSRGDSFYYTDEEEYRDSYSVWFGARSAYEDDMFRIYDDGRVYFVNIGVGWRNSYTKEQIEALSTDDMILLTPQ